MKLSKKSISILVAVIALITFSIFSIRYYNKDQAKEAEISSLKDDIRNLEAELGNLDQLLADKNMDLEEKTNILRAQYDQIEALKDKVAFWQEENYLSKDEIYDLQMTISNLRSEYMYRLNSQMEELLSTKNQFEKLVDSLEYEDSKLRRQVSKLSGSFIKVSENYHEIKQKMDDLSVLRATDFQIINVKSNGKEKQAVEFRRGSINQLKLCFTIQASPLVAAETYELYTLIRQPDGSIASNSLTEFPSGQFVFNDAKEFYSAKQSFDFDQSQQHICLAFQPHEDHKLQKGEQQIEVYWQKKMIGKSSFNIKGGLETDEIPEATSKVGKSLNKLGINPKVREEKAQPDKPNH